MKSVLTIAGPALAVHFMTSPRLVRMALTDGEIRFLEEHFPEVGPRVP